jgi:hypothetical protein
MGGLLWYLDNPNLQRAVARGKLVAAMAEGAGKSQCKTSVTSVQKVKRCRVFDQVKGQILFDQDEGPVVDANGHEEGVINYKGCAKVYSSWQRFGYGLSKTVTCSIDDTHESL